MQSWTDEHPDEKYLKFFRPTFFQATTSSNIAERARAYLRDHHFLDGAIAVFSNKLSTMLDDWIPDFAFENPIMRQKASRIWAEVMHNFARVLMMDLYSLPAELINQWTEIMNIYPIAP